MKQKTPEQIEREVAARILQEAPHADPIVAQALMARLRAQLRLLCGAKESGIVPRI